MKTLTFLLIAIAGLLMLDGCKRQASTRHLSLFAWSEYIPRELIDGFTKKTGIPVDYEVYNSNEMMLAKLTPGSSQYDVIQPSEYAVEHLIKRNLLARLDRTKLPNFGNLLPQYTHMAFDPANDFSVPYMSGTVGIIVNTEKVKEPIRGYEDVFQPKYAGRIIVVDDNREIVSWALACEGIGINDVSPENLQKVRPMLARWLKLVRVYNSDNPRTPLEQGDVDLGVIYSGDAAMLIQQDKKFQYILPREGAHRFVDNLCIPAGSQNQEAALAFIDYCLSPEASALISAKFPYTNPNGAARKLLSADQLANPASYPPQETKLEVFHDIGKSAGDISDMMSVLRQESLH